MAPSSLESSRQSQKRGRNGPCPHSSPKQAWLLSSIHQQTEKPKTNKTARVPESRLFPSSVHSGPFFPCSQPASRQLQRIAPLSTDPPDCSCSVAGVHVESDFPLFSLSPVVVVGKPAGQPLSVPWMAAHLPAGWMDGCHRTRAPELARPFLYQPAIPMLEEGGSQNKSPPPVWWVVFSPRRARSAFGTVPREIDRGKQGKHECLAYIHAA